MTDFLTNTSYQGKFNVTDFHAGDSVNWFINFGNYKPQDGYNLSIYLINATQKLSITALSDTVNNQFSVNLTNLQTQNYVVGKYQYFFILSRTSDNFTAQLPVNFLNIKENILNIANLDYRTDNQKILDLINSCIEGRLATDYVSYKIGDREIVKMTPTELFTQKMRYENLVKQELAAKERLEKGYTKRHQLQVNFVPPWKIY